MIKGMVLVEISARVGVRSRRASTTPKQRRIMTNQQPADEWTNQ